jgi:hypothetical protein
MNAKERAAVMDFLLQLEDLIEELKESLKVKDTPPKQGDLEVGL